MLDVVVRPRGYYLDLGNGKRRFLGSNRIEAKKNIGAARRACRVRTEKKEPLVDRIRSEERRARRARSLAFYQMNHRARERNCAAMTREEFDALWESAGGKCQLTGIRFNAKKAEGTRKRPWMPSVDRIDSSKGYERENCRLVCVAVNIALNDFGLEVLCKIAGALVDKRRRGKLWFGHEADGTKYAFTV